VVADRPSGRSVERATAFIDDLGFSLPFPAPRVVLPSLWEAVAGEDAEPFAAGMVCRSSGCGPGSHELPRRRLAWYGRFLAGRASFLSRRCQPAVSGRGQGHLGGRPRVHFGGQPSVPATRPAVCHNPERATRDAEVRSRIVARLEDKIAGSDRSPTRKRAELAGALKTKPAFNRFLRTTPSGKLRIDRRAVARDAHFDGKFLLRTSDESLTAADIAEGYKALYEA